MLSEAYTYVLLDIISVDVYLVENNLVYTVQVPLVLHCVQCVQNITISHANERYGREIYPYTT